MSLEPVTGAGAELGSPARTVRTPNPELPLRLPTHPLLTHTDLFREGEQSKYLLS